MAARLRRATARRSATLAREARRASRHGRHRLRGARRGRRDRVGGRARHVRRETEVAPSARGGCRSQPRSRRWSSGWSSSSARVRASATRADAVAMHALMPDPSLYPAEPFRRALNRALARGGAGAPALRQPAGRRAAARGARRAPARRGARRSGPTSSCCATARARGSRSRCACSATPGDAVAVEEPTYNNVLGAAIALGLRAAPVPMRDGGARPRAARADARAPRREGVLHDPDLPQSDGHDDRARAPSRAARGRGARRASR